MHYLRLNTTKKCMEILKIDGSEKLIKHEVNAKNYCIICPIKTTSYSFPDERRKDPKLRL